MVITATRFRRHSVDLADRLCSGAKKTKTGIVLARNGKLLPRCVDIRASSGISATPLPLGPHVVCDLWGPQGTQKGLVFGRWVILGRCVHRGGAALVPSYGLYREMGFLR